MPQTTVAWRKEASVDELAARSAEMRGEYAELVAAHPDRASDGYRTAHRQFMDEVEDIDVNQTLRGMEQIPEQFRGKTRGGDNGAIGGNSEVETRSAGEIVTQDPEFLEWCKRNASKSSISESPSVELRALVAEGDGNGSGTLLPVGQPYLVDQRRRRLFIRDLIGVQQTGLAAVPYVRELNPVTNALSASTVTEGATKPEATVQFQADLAPVQVIAASIPITTQILEDAPTLVGYINGRLVYMLKYREEDEILRGNGVTPDLKGIMNFAGVQTQAAVGTADKPTTIGAAIAKIELVDGFADGIAMNPATFWEMVTHRASTSGIFDAGAFTQAPIQYVWGLPVVRTNAMATNQNLVGNFGMGATLFDRSQSGVRVFEQHGTFAAENKVLLLAEERVALAVNRPDFFCITTTN